ncbi:hypothetical protein NL676_028740 [Syzygium grande]|nr:hypothetical protein NL676_028740 [Syzygium grande]
MDVLSHWMRRRNDLGAAEIAMRLGCRHDGARPQDHCRCPLDSKSTLTHNYAVLWPIRTLGGFLVLALKTLVVSGFEQPFVDFDFLHSTIEFITLVMTTQADCHCNCESLVIVTVIITL